MKTKLAAALFASLALVACEQAGDKPSDDPSKPTPVTKTVETPAVQDGVKPAETPEPAGARSDGVSVTLIDAGAEPRQKLRFKVKKGQTFKAEMRMTMDMRMQIDGAAPPSVKLPVMVAVMDIATTDATEDTFSFDWKISRYDVVKSPGVMPQVLSALKTQLAQLVGTKGSAKIDSRGRNLGSTFEIPPGVAPQTAKLMEGMREAISTMSAPVPEEAIGVGGSWKVSQNMVQNGMTSKVDYVYTVKALTGEQAELGAVVTTTGVPGPVEGGLLPPGASATLDSMTGSGGGELTLRFDTIVPVRSKISTDNTSKMTVKAMGRTQKTVTDIKMGIEMKAL